MKQLTEIEALKPFHACAAALIFGGIYLTAATQPSPGQSITMKFSTLLLALTLICGFATGGNAAARLTVDKYVEFFDIIAFGSEIQSARALQMVRKWPGKLVKYKIAGSAKAAAFYRPTIERHAKALKTFTGLTLKEIPGKAPGEDLIFVFAKRDTMITAGRLLEKNERVLRQMARGNCYFLSYTMPDGRIVKGLIAINSELERLKIEHCLLEEMAQSMGLRNDSPLVSPSIFNDSEKHMSLTLIDKVLLRTLYDKRMISGMPRRPALVTAKKIVRSLMKKAN